MQGGKKKKVNTRTKLRHFVVKLLNVAIELKTLHIQRNNDKTHMTSQQKRWRSEKLECNL